MNERNNERIKAFDGLKGVSAVLIAFFYHYYAHFIEISDLPLGTYIGFVYKNGFLAVELFFMISGYTIYLRYYKDILYKKTTFKNYIFKRIKALFPMMLITLLCVTVVQFLYLAVSGHTFYDDNFDIIHFIMNLFMIQGAGTNDYSFNLPTWFISVLILCYILFYAATTAERKMSKKMGGGWVYAIPIIIGWLCMMLQIHAPFFDCEFAARGYVCFFLGVMVSKVESQNESRKQLFLIALLVVVAIISTLAVRFGIPGQGRVRIVLLWVLYPIMIIIASKNNAFSRIMGSRLFVWLGKISNGIFFWHFPVQVLLALILKLFHVDHISGYVLMGIYVVIVLCISCIYNKTKKELTAMNRKVESPVKGV